MPELHPLHDCPQCRMRRRGPDTGLIATPHDLGREASDTLSAELARLEALAAELGDGAPGGTEDPYAGLPGRIREIREELARRPE